MVTDREYIIVLNDEIVAIEQSLEDVDEMTRLACAKDMTDGQYTGATSLGEMLALAKHSLEHQLDEKTKELDSKLDALDPSEPCPVHTPLMPVHGCELPTCKRCGVRYLYFE